MKVTEVIKELQKVVEKHGDLPCVVQEYGSGEVGLVSVDLFEVEDRVWEDYSGEKKGGMCVELR